MERAEDFVLLQAVEQAEELRPLKVIEQAEDLAPLKVERVEDIALWRGVERTRF